jgi:hypothetical protein
LELWPSDPYLMQNPDPESRFFVHPGSQLQQYKCTGYQIRSRNSASDIVPRVQDSVVRTMLERYTKEKNEKSFYLLFHWRSRSTFFFFFRGSQIT